MDSVCLREPSADLRRHVPRTYVKACARLVAVCTILFASVPAQRAQAAVLQQVQSGTTSSSGVGTTTVTISSIDMTKSVLIFQASSNNADPGGSEVRGRLASATTIEFIREHNDPGVVVDIQWYLATFGSGVFVQRGMTAQTTTVVNIPITSVTNMSQAFVLHSKTPVAADATWGMDDSVVGELTSATQLTFRSDGLNVGHFIEWQVVQFTNAADINVQKGSITTMTGATLTRTATLSPAVNVNKTFVLVSVRAPDSAATDMGARMVRAVLTNSTTITFDRAVAGVTGITEIVWQAVELKDGSSVQSASASFASGVATATAGLIPSVNLTRAVPFISTQGGGGQNMGMSPYVGNDIPGVATATAELTATDQLTLTRNNTASSADLGWFVVQFDGGTPFKVGSFTKSTGAGPASQVIPHALGQVPKAMILWTEGRTDETFGAVNITFRGATSASTTGAGGTIAQDVSPAAAFGDRSTAGTTVTTAAFTTSSPNELLLAFVAFGGGAGSTVTGVTGAGLTWQLVRRTTVQNGPAEIWRAFAPTTLSGVTVTATLSVSADASIGVMSFTGVDTSGTNGSGAIGSTGSGNANGSGTTNAPTATLTTSRANSVVVGVGTDWDNDIARTIGGSQTMLHQFLAVTLGDTFWMQRWNGAVAGSGTPVTINDTAPNNNRYNLTIAEVLASLPTLSIDVPSGTVANDVMVASIAFRPDTATITPPAGWTLVRETDNAGGSANSLATYYKVATGSEPASYSWTFSTSTGAVGGIQSFDGVDTTTPVDVENGQTTGSALTHATPAVTTTMANAMIVTSHSFSSSSTWTPPAGMTEAVDETSLAAPDPLGLSMEANHVFQPAIGTTGTKTATAVSPPANVDFGNAHILALRPAGGAGSASFGFGMTDGATSRSLSASSQNIAATSNAASRLASKVLTIVQWGSPGVVLAEADFASWDDTNVTLNWTTNDASAYVVHYIAVGGSDLSAKVVPWTMGPASGNRVVTGVPFQPNVVLHAYGSYLQSTASPVTTAGASFGLGAMDAGSKPDDSSGQWANAFFTVDGSANADTQRGQQIDATLYAFDAALGVQRRATFVSMNSNGFTVNFSPSASAVDAQVISLALAGLNAQVGNFDKVASPTTTQVVTGVNFQPAAVLLTSFQDVPRTSGPVAHSRFGIGASDGTTEGSSAFQDENAAATTNMIGVDKTSKVFVKTDNNTTAVGTIIDAEADLTSMNADGFTLNWTKNDAVQTQILYLALAQMNNTEVRLISFDATRYDSGVLLQWGTGYEIDNLGFNLYRDIDGIRSAQPLNSSLIAGSGLQAGQGGMVTAAQSYARWDMSAGTSPTLKYWLEDVEFNGKSTWHGPYTPVVSHLQEPATIDSDELADLGNAATDSRRIFFSYNEDPAHPGPRVVPAQVAPEVTRQWALAGQATVKMGIRKPGWYRVTRAELIAAGLGSGVDPAQLQLFVNGIEQAIRVNGATGSSFASIEFYASGIDTPYTDTRIYWLESGGAQAGRRIAFDPGGLSAPSPLTGFPSRLRRKDRIWYSSAIMNGDAENWFGPMVCPESATPEQECDSPWAPAALTLTASHIDRSPGGTAQLNVAVQGVTSATDGGANHRIGVLVNGIAVGEMEFAGQARAEQTFSVAVADLVDGENTVAFRARGGNRDINLVDAIALSYPHTYQADADRLRFTVDAPASITLGGFAGSSIRIFDITDRTAPVQLPATPGTDAGLSTVTVHVPGTGPRTLMAFSDETVATPEFVRANQPSNLHASSHASNYVVISHADFLAPVAVLAAHRQQQGHQAVVVNVEDVYDEFSFGEKTPQAIRDFLRWARTNWATAPKFVVLAGDATVDPRDYDGLGFADYVPTKQVAMTSVLLETASDDWFVDFADNGLPEIAIGRLSVRTAADAAAVVAKIVGYDNQAPGQSWMKDVLLVADQDLTENFERTGERLGALLPPAYAAHTVFRSRLGGAAAHQQLQDRVNAGQLIVNYVGHGSTGIWGSSGELLSKADVTGSWTNAARLPFVVAMNCLNGFFNATYGDGNDEASLAEAMVRAPNGGAVAVWASSSLTPASTQARVNEELFRLIFAGTYATLGEAVTAAKRVVANQDLRRSWIFFGDPAMRLSGALQPASTNAPVITAQPRGANVASGQRARLTVAATGSAPLTYQWYVGVSGQRTNPIFGGTSSHYTTQVVANGTSYWVRVENPYGAADSSTAVISTHTAAHDYDGDNTADLMVYRPSAGTWFRRLATTQITDGTATAFGLTGDVPVPGDYDGDGTTDLAVYRPVSGTWFIRPSGGGAVLSYAWGLRTDIPSPGDYDGDGRADLAVYRPASGNWMIRRSRDGYATAGAVTVALGLRTDLPVPADYDGDGTTDLAIFRPATGTWYLLMSGDDATTPRVIQWGLRGDVPVPGDYDGDGRADLAVYRPASGVWYLLKSSTNFTSSAEFPWGLPRDVPVPADYDGDGVTDLAIYRPPTGEWFIRQSTTDNAMSVTIQWGLPDDIPVPNATVAHGMSMLRRAAALTRTADLDGDAKADLTVYRPATGTWYTRASRTNYATTATFQWGLAGDTLVPADYDGDGTTDVAVYRPVTGMWHIRQSTTNFAASVSFQWGLSGDVPVPGDYDGDGLADLAVYRPATGVWYLLTSSTHFATTATHQWGLPADIPVPGDYDGDGLTDLAVYRPATGVWYLLTSSTHFTTTATHQWGLPHDLTVPGDYDGDGRTDLAVYRPSTGVWFLLWSSTNFTTFVTVPWGLGDDLPVPGDYDGDGKTDLAVWRPAEGRWYFFPSSASLAASSSVQWGLAGDVPIPTRP